jgi:hypothetical protein
MKLGNTPRAQFLLFLAASIAYGQNGTLLLVEIADSTAYVRDTTDLSLIATNPNPTPALPSRNFRQVVTVGDIVTVNGRPAKGTLIQVNTNFVLQPDAPVGAAIADIRRNNWSESYFEFLLEDGLPMGAIRVSGLNSQVGFGLPPPGQSSQIVGGSHVVVGGNGAFVGVRGYMGATTPGTTRAASMVEDPANRRINRGGVQHWGIYLIPMSRPEVVSASGQPAVVHASDSQLVTAARPARAGEILTLFASGLGPTRPGAEPDQPFAGVGRHLCTSPIEVLVNGRPSEVLYAGGYPGSVDRYQVNFRVPESVTAGPASVQLGAAWILGPEVKIPVQ